jgi:hypothetical protein
MFSGQFCFSLGVLSGFWSLELPFFRASSAFKLFEAGLRSLELPFFRASSAFKLFEAGLRSLELPFFRASSAFNLFEARLRSLELPFFRASSAFKLFETGLWSLEVSSSGQQCLQVIRDRALVPRIIFFGRAVPSNCLSLGFSPSNHLFRASSASALFKFGLLSLESLFRAINTLNTRILVAIYQFGCRMSNMKVSPRFATPDGPVFVSSALCRETFHTYGMKFAPMDVSGASQ